MKIETKKPHSWEWFLYKANNDTQLALQLKQNWVNNIAAARKNKSNFKRLSREWYIERYGEIEGNAKFEDFRTRSIQTLSNYQRKYGQEEGQRRYDEVISKKSQSKERFIELYGQEEGIKKYEVWLKAKASKEYLCEKYGEEEGTRRYNTACNNRKQALSNITKPWAGKPRLQYFIEKYGEEEGNIRYKKWYEGTQIPRNKSTKKALEVFKLLHDYCTSKGISSHEVYYGGDNKNEWIIWNEDQSIKHSYDFTIRQLKIIVEYDGAAWHPTEQQIIENPTGKLPKGRFTSLKEKYEWDKAKIKHAEDRGWNILIIRSDLSIIDLNNKLQFIKQTIQEKYNEICNN